MDTVLQTTADCLTDTLSREPWGLHNYAQVVDFCAWMSGLTEGAAKHLCDLTLAEQQVALERIANCVNPYSLKADWMDARVRDMQAQTTARLNAEAEAWLR